MANTSTLMVIKKQVECDITTLYFYSFNDHMVIKIGRAILNTSLVTYP